MLMARQGSILSAGTVHSKLCRRPPRSAADGPQTIAHGWPGAGPLAPPSVTDARSSLAPAAPTFSSKMFDSVSADGRQGTGPGRRGCCDKNPTIGIRHSDHPPLLYFHTRTNLTCPARLTLHRGNRRAAARGSLRSDLDPLNDPPIFSPFFPPLGPFEWPIFPTWKIIKILSPRNAHELPRHTHARISRSDTFLSLSHFKISSTIEYLSRAGKDAMRFLPSALNVKVNRFNRARVNGGGNRAP